MATYAIGDVQGCYQPLARLLEAIRFDPAEDSLWFAGDLVNRGPESLKVLRFIYALGPSHRVILGNHDLHLLAVGAGYYPPQPEDTLNDILQSEDKEHLLHWLRQQPLLVYDASLNFLMVHAGICPHWSLQQALALAQEVELILKDQRGDAFLANMYGNLPDLWQENLCGIDRTRCIVNYLTRVRYCNLQGRMDLNFKGNHESAPPGYYPWYQLMQLLDAKLNIVFGHWAALNGKTQRAHIFALDTGCVWGNCLTALRLEDQVRFSVKC